MEFANNLTLLAKPKNANHLVTKGYVDRSTDLGKPLSCCKLTMSVDQEYTSTTLSSETATLKLDTVKGNLELNPTTNTVKLKANCEYVVNICLSVRTNTRCGLLIKNETTGSYLPIVRSDTGNDNQNATFFSQEYIQVGSDDAEYTFILAFVDIGDYVIRSDYTSIMIQEISRNISPTQITNNKYGLEDLPVGHIVELMTTKAPKHYTLCNNDIYNIADLPHLAQAIEEDFGYVNYFGGDGVTTFAVPNYGVKYTSIIPTMSSHSQNGYVVTASSEFSSYYPAWQAFDKVSNPEGSGNPECSWISAKDVSDGWVCMQFPVPVKISRYSVGVRHHAEGYGITQLDDFEVLGSVDGITWDVIDSKTAEPSWSNGEKRYYDVQTTDAYTYYKLHVSKFHDQAYIAVGEFDLFACTSAYFIKHEPTYYMFNKYEITSDSSLETYSTEETVIGLYLGKPLYRKVVRLEDLECTTTENNIDIISDASNLELIKVAGTINWETTMVVAFPFYYTHPNTDYGILIDYVLSGNVLKLRTVQDSGSNKFSANIIVEYTKTTD